MTAAGVELGAEAVAGVVFSIGGKVERMFADHERRRQLLDSLSLLTKSAALPAAAAGGTLLDLGGPAASRAWEITTIAVTGADDRTALVGSSVAVYATQPGPVGAVSLGDLVLPASDSGTAQAVPFSTTFGRRQFAILAPNHLVVIVYGVAAAAPLVATARGWDHDAADLSFGREA